MPPTTPDPTPQAINNVWGQSTIGQSVFLTLPSGQTCHAKVVGIQGVLEAGVLGEADSLTAFVGRDYIRKVRGAKGKPDFEEIDPQKLLKDPATLQKIVKMVDGLMPHVIVNPVVACHYRVVNEETKETMMIGPDVRISGVIYTDQIPLEDKMFIFNFAMSGVKEVETFRKQSEVAMGDVADGEGVPDQAQRPGGNRASRRQRPPRRR